MVVHQDFWEIKCMCKQWIPGLFFLGQEGPGYEAKTQSISLMVGLSVSIYLV